MSFFNNGRNYGDNKMSNFLRMYARYRSARMDLLLVIIFTVVNILMFNFGSGTVMLFSASVPYYAVVFGTVLENDPEILLTGAYNIGVVIAIVSVLLYLLCWVFSKKKYVWMIVSAVLFSIDTLALIGLYIMMGEISGVLDILMHALVLYYLIAGAVVGKQLKKLDPEAIKAQLEEMARQQNADISPVENVEVDYSVEDADEEKQEEDKQEVAEQESAAEEEKDTFVLQDSTPLRLVDTEDEKARILCRAEYMGLDIIYRRVKRTNELVINGRVYDEVEMLVETPHELKAVVYGKKITAGLKSSSSQSYISVDGKVVAKKLRLW